MPSAPLSSPLARLGLLIAVLAGLFPTARAQIDRFHWYDISEYGVEGKGWSNTRSFYDRLPARAEALARDQDGLFGQMSRPVTHYHFPGDAYHRRLNRLVLQMVRQGRLPPKPILIFPRLFTGETIKSLFAGAS